MAPRAWPRLAPAAFDDTHRLIPGIYTEDAEHALAALADDDDGTLALITLAAATNARLQAQEERHPGGLTRADLVFGVPYSRIINAAFAYPGQGARFHSPHGPGAWYCALDLDTCIAEVAHHRVRHLHEMGETDEHNIPYRLFLADVHAQDVAWLDDARPQTRACLRPDDHTAGRELGQRLRAEGVSAVVYPSVRQPGGTNIAVLAAPVVANVRRDALVHISIADGALATVHV